MGQVFRNAVAVVLLTKSIHLRSALLGVLDPKGCYDEGGGANGRVGFSVKLVDYHGLKPREGKATIAGLGEYAGRTHFGECLSELSTNKEDLGSRIPAHCHLYHCHL